MVTNHIEALEECMNNPTISAEAKTHITALYNQMVDRKASRLPDKKGQANGKIRATLETELQFNTDYTMNEIIDIASASGIDKAVITPHRISGIFPLERQKTKIVDAYGNTVSIYRRRNPVV